MPNTPKGVSANAQAFDSQVFDDTRERVEQKVYNKATLEDDFTNDRVIVVLNRETTRRFKNYTPKDFPEIDCVQVNDLTAPTVEWAEEQITRSVKNNEVIQTGDNAVLANDKAMLVDAVEFRRILSLELREQSKENVLNAIKQLEKRNDIISAEPNYTFAPSSNYPNNQVFTNPNDPRWSTWGHWAIEKIQAPKAWEIATGSADVVVGIVDTGIDFTHPDLQNRMDQRPNVHRNFLNSSAALGTPETPFDVWVGNHPTQGWVNGHGTQTAGVIGGEGGNGRGVPGVCWDVRLVSLRTYDFNGGYYDAMVRAINYAASISIPIIDLAHQNTSATTNQQTALRNVLNAYNGLAVSSAGNWGYDLDNPATPTYPAVMTSNKHIVVGALDANDNKASYSNYGKNTVDLFSYGTRVLTTAPGGGYTYFSGTSSSAPLVAGVAALIMSEYDGTPAFLIKDVIMSSTDKTSALSTLCVSGGRLNAYNALQMVGKGMWIQPSWTSNTTTSDGVDHGFITASDHYGNELPYGAFDGWQGSVANGNSEGYPAAQWVQRSRDGWIRLTLKYDIIVHSIEFLNSYATSSQRTKDAYFTGMGHIALGAPFTAPDSNEGRRVVQVGGVRTNIIQLNIISSHASSLIAGYIGANEIIIHATKASPRYDVDFDYPPKSFSTTAIEGENAVFPLAAPRKIGYIFMGWSVDGTNVIDLQNYPIFEDTTFVAIFDQGDFETVWSGSLVVKPIGTRVGSVDLKALCSDPLDDMEIRVTFVATSGVLVGTGDFIVPDTPFGTTMSAIVRLVITVNSNFILTFTDPTILSTVQINLLSIEVREK